MKPIFTISRSTPTASNAGGYSHLTMHLLIPSVWGSGYNTLFSLRWQTDADASNDPNRQSSRWYGLDVKAEWSGSGMSLLRCAKEAAKLMAKVLPDGQRHTPDAVLERCAAAGIKHAVYDRRAYTEVLVAKAAPVEHQRFSEASGRFAIAKDEAAARAAITKEWAAEVAENERKAPGFSEWIAAGSPVKWSDAPAPCLRPAEYFIASPYAPQAVPA